jgi:hemolysin activation/secretion protein
MGLSMTRIRLVSCLLSSLCALVPVARAQDAAPAEQAGTAAPFDVLELRVLGNTQLTADEIERAVYPFMGPGRSIAEVEQARDALALVYRNKGLGAVYVDIPEQDVTEGVVRLKVTEGTLDRVRVTGATYFSNGKIRQLMPSARQGEVLNTTTLQQEIAAVNSQNRDLVAVPVLRSGSEPGRVDLEIKVDDKLPFHYGFEVTDRYTANTSRTRVGLTASFDNLFQANHSLSLQVQTAPEEPNESRVLAATYSLPLVGNHRLSLYAIDSNSDVAAVGTLSVQGAGSIYGARAMLSLPAIWEGSFHSIAIGADYKDFTDTIRLTGSNDLTPITYLTMSAQYSLGWTGQLGSGSLNIGPTVGVRGFANTVKEFAYKRAAASPGFVYVRGSGQHQFKLPGGLAFFVRGSAQLTNQPLISNEQFALGGADTVRGYLESSALADRGASGTFELRSMSFVSRLGPWANEAYLGVFADAGWGQTLNHLAGQQEYSRLWSYGLGLRFAGWNGFKASLDWAMPRTSIGDVEAGDSRIHFGVSYAH